MNPLLNINILIACWSVVWAFTVFALGILKATHDSGVIYTLFLYCRKAHVDDVMFILAVPIYVFGFWCAGNIVIILIHRLFRRFNR